MSGRQTRPGEAGEMEGGCLVAKFFNFTAFRLGRNFIFAETCTSHSGRAPSFTSLAHTGLLCSKQR